MTLLDALMGEYRCTLRDALLFPISAALALWPALARRCGWELEDGPDASAWAAIAARKAVRDHIAEHYQIVEDPVQS